jgi:hypothetical protein
MNIKKSTAVVISVIMIIVTAGLCFYYNSMKTDELKSEYLNTVSNLEYQISTKNNELSITNTKIEDYENEISALREDNSNKDESITEYTNIISGYELQIANLNLNSSTLEKEIVRLSENNQEYQNSIDYQASVLEWYANKENAGLKDFSTLDELTKWVNSMAIWGVPGFACVDVSREAMDYAYQDGYRLGMAVLTHYEIYNVYSEYYRNLAWYQTNKNTTDGHMVNIAIVDNYYIYMVDFTIHKIWLIGYASR